MGSLHRVAAALAVAGVAAGLREMPDGTRAEAAAAVSCELNRIVKSILLASAACLFLFLTPGDHQIDPAAAARLAGAALSHADGALVGRVTGFAIGGVAPAGSLTPLPTWADPRLLSFPCVRAAAGTPRHGFALPPAGMVRLAGATLAPVVAAG